MKEPVLDWKEVADVVRQSTAMAAPSRAAFLNTRCPAGGALRREIEAVLAQRGRIEAPSGHPAVLKRVAGMKTGEGELVDLSLSGVSCYGLMASASETSQGENYFKYPRETTWRITPGVHAPVPPLNFVGRLLGSGGMADVYLVQDTVRDCELALKRRRLAARSSAPGSRTLTRGRPAQLDELRLRFRHEFASMSKLIHPNIARA